MDERRMTNEQRERERRRKAAAARKAAARYEDPGVGYQRRRRARKRRRRVRNVCIALLVIFIVVIGLAGGTIYWIKYGPTKETYDLNKYFGITAKSQMGVTINNEVLDAQAITEGGTAYLSYNFVQDYISDRFYWDSNEHMLLYTLPRDMVKAAADSKDYSVSDTVNSEDYTIVKTEGDTAYIALDFLQKYANFDYEVYKDPARVVITSKFGERQTAKVKDDSQVRILGGVKSPVLEEVKKGDKLTVLEDVSDWKKVCTKSGIVGYIQKSKLKDAKKETISREFEEPDYTGIKKDYKINLVWHQVTSEAANEGIEDALAATKGLNTISPTWFSVTDNSGNISSIASTDYVDYAHQCGLEVWALVDNFDQNVDDMELLSHTSSRENLENQLVNAALQNGIDGINVDFEQIPTDVGDHYIQFIRELSVLCRVNNLVLSVDNYVPKGYNTHYHREEQGVMADYVIIMGYDEHFAGSYEAGSVASYNYVKEGIEETLRDVPADKVINAVPFYTRLWNETPKTDEERAEDQGTEAESYSMKVTSEALGMEEAAQRVSEAGATVTWDDTVKQNYAEWQGDNDSTYRIWLEDASSLEVKLGLMKDNNLAGTAAWKLGFETSDIWDLIRKYVN